MFDSTQTDQPAPAPGCHPGASPALHPELALRLPADAYYHLVRTLRLTLPPPPGPVGVDGPTASRAKVELLATNQGTVRYGD